jgi:hypothetical protein
MKVKENTIKIKMTLPPDSQNSASPKTLMARTLRIPYRTIQARGIAHGGISSLQKSRTVDRAVISKGIRRAS